MMNPTTAIQSKDGLHVASTRQAKALSLNQRISGMGIYVVLILGLVIVFTPIVWVVSTSLKQEFQYNTYPPQLIPEEWVFDNYNQALTMAPFVRYFRNSVVVATLYATLNVLSSSLAGYAFARIKAPGKNALFSVVVATIMVPWVVLGIPQFIVFSKIGLVNSYWPWVLWGLSGAAWHIFLFRQFFMSFPREIEEAAEVDGCGRFAIFTRIVLPNSLPVVATSFIFSFQWVWGDWVTALLYLNDDLTTLPVVLAGTIYVDPQVNAIVTITMAAVVLYALPLVIVFFFAQRYILEGVVTSGLKG